MQIVLLVFLLILGSLVFKVFFTEKEAIKNEGGFVRNILYTGNNNFRSNFIQYSQTQYEMILGNTDFTIETFFQFTSRDFPTGEIGENARLFSIEYWDSFSSQFLENSKTLLGVEFANQYTNIGYNKKINLNLIAQSWSSNTYTDAFSLGGTDLTNYLYSYTDDSHDLLWHHLAVSYQSNTNLLNLYLDGRLFTSATWKFNLSRYPYNSFSLYIAGQKEGLTETNYNGQISEFRIVTGQALYTGSTISIPEIPFIVSNNTPILLQFNDSATSTLSSISNSGNGQPWLNISYPPNNKFSVSGNTDPLVFYSITNSAQWQNDDPYWGNPPAM